MNATSEDVASGREWRTRVESFRTYPTLRRKSESPEAVGGFLRSLSDHALRAAADLPDHAEAAHRLAHEEIAFRGLSQLPPLTIPGFVSEGNLERALQDVTGWGSILRRRSVLAIHVAFFAAAALFASVLVAASLNVHSPILDQLTFASFIVLLIVAVASALVTLILTWFRRFPFRVLFLRKFNSNKLGPIYRRLLGDELAVFGHVIALSDRAVRRSMLRWIGDIFDPYMKSFSGGLVVGVIGLVSAFAIVFPLMIVLRCFDPTRWGPAHVASARDFRLFARRLTDRIELNGETTSEASGYLVRTSDQWWKHVAALLIHSSDVIVLDISNVTSGTAWEIEQIEIFSLWNRVVPIVQASSRAVGSVVGLPKRVIDDAHAYDKKGRFQDRGAFLDAMSRAASAAIAAR